MKKVRKEHIEAAKFFIENNEKSFSKTKVGEIFGSDRHSILQFQNCYNQYFVSARPEDVAYYFCFSRNEKEAIDYYLSHSDVTKAEICKKFKIGKTTTFDNWLEICGFSSKRRYKYNYNRDYFKQEPNEEMCYWLGFLLADGCITGSHDRYHIIQVRVGDKDKEHVFKFGRCLGYSEDQLKEAIKTTIGGAYTKDNICWSLDVSSTEIVQDVARYNILPKKSMKEKPYIFDSESLQLAYIRGIIDGDGWISSPDNRNKKMGVCGSKEVCEYIRNFLSQYTDQFVSEVFVKQSKKDDPNCLLYGWNMTNQKGTADILQHLYPKNTNPNTYLTRKFDNAWAVIKSLN